MRILHFTETFSGNTETFIYNYVCSLAAVGGEHIVATLKRCNMETRPYDKVYLVELPPKWHVERIWSRIAITLNLALDKEQYVDIQRRRLMKLVKCINPHAIHAQFGPAGVLIAPIAKKLQIPLLVTFLGYDISQLVQEPFWQTRYQEHLCRDGVYGVGVSNYICNKLITIGFNQKQVILLHNGVNIERFEYTDPSARFDGKHINCIQVGRLTAKKDPVTLVKAFALVHKKLLPDRYVSLTIAGDGPLRQEVESTIANLDIQHAVNLLGTVSHDEVPRLFKDAHIYTQHSVTAPNGDEEGQPTSLAEASACGLPIVSTKHDGIPDVVIDGVTGYLVEEGDIEAMADRLTELCMRPELWSSFGYAGRLHVEQNFNLATQAQKAHTILSQITSCSN